MTWDTINIPKVKSPSELCREELTEYLESGKGFKVDDAIYVPAEFELGWYFSVDKSKVLMYDSPEGLKRVYFHPLIIKD
jgi:hypothetical protein